jgi:hypothetical protein
MTEVIFPALLSSAQITGNKQQKHSDANASSDEVCNAVIYFNSKMLPTIGVLLGSHKNNLSVDNISHSIDQKYRCEEKKDNCSPITHRLTLSFLLLIGQ